MMSEEKEISVAKKALLAVKDLLIDRLQQEKFFEVIQICRALEILVNIKSEELINFGLPPLR